jgi:two-component system sensor histidine kinase ChiS
LVEQRTALAFAPLNRLYLVLGLLLIALTMLVVFAAFRFSDAFIRPIIKLTGAITAISQGKLDAAVEGTERKDELGDLARAFDRTLVSLKLAMRGKQE